MSEPVIEAPPAEVMYVGTVNLARFMAWAPREPAVVQEIDSMKLDIICFQETPENFDKRLVKLLSPIGDWFEATDHINCPLFARADKFEPLEWNGKESIRHDMPGSVRKRYGSSALLRRRSDGFVAVYTTLHPSNTSESSNSATDRVRQAKAAWQDLEDWGVTHLPMMIVGDMNDKLWAPRGIPGVFVGHGLTDILKELGQKATIDRGFCKGFTPLSTTVNPVSNRVSDHDFRLFIVRPGVDASPEPEEPEEPAEPAEELSLLERLNKIHGKVTKFKVAKFEEARVADYGSRYTAIVQDWLGVEVTCVWSDADQAALDEWRHATFPTWPEADYTGPVGVTSMAELARQAKVAGKKIYPVVEK